MRYTGPCRFRYFGDETVAQKYAPIAREILGTLMASTYAPLKSRSVTLANGVRISVRFQSQPRRNDRNWAEDLIEMSWGGEFNIEATITVPEGRTVSEPRDGFQYQFVYAGDRGQSWQVSELGPPFNLPVVGGLAVGVVFILMEDGGVEHAAFPLASTREDVQSDDWPYYSGLGDFNDYIAWEAQLPVPRHEVVLATSEHLEQPDKRNVVHAPWMPKGQRHYMANAYSLASLRETGAYFPFFTDSGGIVNYTQVATLGAASTDVGYEAALEPFTPPQNPSLNIVPGQPRAAPSAPDADWYTSYGVQTVEDEEFGTKRFGVLIDAAQRIYVWNLDAAGTDTPNPTYVSQAIKTNVADEFVKSQLLVFPNNIALRRGSFRDEALEGVLDVGVFQGSTVGDLTRYIWYPSSDGTRFAAVVEEEHPPLHPVHRQADGTFQPLTPALNYQPRLQQEETYPYRINRPRVLELNLAITLTGSGLDQFEISVDAAQVDVPDELQVIQARYAGARSFDGVEKDQLLVGGFEIHTLRPLQAAANSTLARYMDGEQNVLAASGNEPFNQASFFTATSQEAYLTPLRSSVLTTYEDPRVDLGTQGNLARSVFGARRLIAGRRYEAMDYAFASMSYTHFTRGSFSEDFGRPFQPCFTMEGYFKVYAGEDEVFRKTVRKYEGDERFMADWFTAQVSALDLSSGSVAFGLCRSKSHTTSIDEELPWYGETNTYPNYEDVVCTNTSIKGHAIYWHGRRVAAREQEPELLVTLDQPLEALEHPYLGMALTPSLINYDVRFWGTAFYSPALVQPPSILQIPSINTPAYNTGYVSDVLEGGQVPTIRVTQGFVGFRQFPWPWEMANWFAHNHHPDTASETLLANEDLCSYVGGYIEVPEPVRLSAEENSRLDDETIEPSIYRDVDVLIVAGREFTHAQMVTEAFGVTPEVAIALDWRAQVAPESQDDPSESYFGFYWFRTQRSVPQELADFRFVSMFTNEIKLPQDGEFVLSINYDMPRFRMYCGMNDVSLDSMKFLEGDPPSDIIELVRLNGLASAPYQSRAYGYFAGDD